MTAVCASRRTSLPAIAARRHGGSTGERECRQVLKAWVEEGVALSGKRHIGTEAFQEEPRWLENLGQAA